MENNDIYNKEFLTNSLNILEDTVDDLEKWSAWNGDKIQANVMMIKIYVANLIQIKDSLQEKESNHEPQVTEYLKNNTDEENDTDEIPF